MQYKNKVFLTGKNELFGLERPLLLGVLIVVMKTKTFTVLTNQKALLVSRNAKKNLKNNSENENVRHLITGMFLKFVLFSS